MTDVTWNPAGDDDTSFGPLTAHNVLGGRTAADAHPAAAVSYDNDVSGLTGDTVQEAIDELATHEGLTTTAHGGIVASTDPRLTDARPPTAHEASHHHDGSDPLDAGDVGAVPVEAVGLLPGETNRGTWDIAATYAVGDVVFETGSDLFVATAPSTGAQPSLTPGSWDLLDPTGRRIHLGPGATSGDYGLSVGTVATSGDGGTSVGYGATAGDFGLSVGTVATAGVYGLSVGTVATAGDYGVNVANTYRATLDPGDPTTPLTATIATGHVDLPETADATNPPADHQRLVARTDGLYVRDETGTEVGPLGAAHKLAKVVNGEYCAPMSWQATTNHGMTAAGHMTAVPVVLPAGTAARLTVSCSVNAVSTWRLGIYPADPVTMLPTGQAPVVDAGTISLASGSVIYATLSQPIAAGLYWVAALVDAWTATPTVYGSGGSSAGAAPVILPQTTALNGAVIWTLRLTGVATGALPAVCPAMNPSYNAPRVTVRMT